MEFVEGETLDHLVKRSGRLEVKLALDAPLYLAWAYRLLDEKAKAYCILEKYLTQRTLLKIPLGLDNPILNVFRRDPEFNSILADLNLKFGAARQSIREHEASSGKR